jgi:P4 family phage/plasmid primase-like protien
MTDLVSVIPPGAPLLPSSKIVGSQLGKVPGRKYPSGLWGGYAWQKHEPTIDDVRTWCLDGANIGLRAGRWPAIDIDCLDEGIAKMVEGAALRLGAAPVRIGRAPKRLLMFRTNEPFARMQLKVAAKDTEYLVEILGVGQQYLVSGIHPTTRAPYTWNIDLATLDPQSLPLLTRERANQFMKELEDLFTLLDIGKCTRVGDGSTRERAANTDQTSLLAPSIDALREAVSFIPNTNELFPDRMDYLKIAYAIRSSCGEDLEEGFAIFAEWAGKWEGNGRHAKNEPDVVRSDWRRLAGPYYVGWDYLAEIARGHGYNDAANDFTGVDAPVEEVQAPLFSDQWLAKRVIERAGHRLRYMPEAGTWYVWDGSRWAKDAISRAEDVIKRELLLLADQALRHGVTPQEVAAAKRRAESICSAAKITAVRSIIQSDPDVVVITEALDYNPWILNTPGGMVDLKTGDLLPPDPDQLCTRSTAVAPDFSGSCPEWRRFLAEATAGDRELESYLQRLAGYCLTGITKEQVVIFIHGSGGHGKGTTLDAWRNILASYAQVADMATFTASPNDRHTTDLADLRGARIVTSSETQEGRRWDEQRVKLLSGGDIVKARFMRQDNFAYKPQFKLVFYGNHKPEIRNLDDAMRRRLQLVPFTQKPAVVDLELDIKLKAEWPAILAWMIEGCLTWQREGLRPPERVRAETEQYFDDEDAVGKWIRECCLTGDEHASTTDALFQSWREWAGRAGEFAGNLRRLANVLSSRRYARWRHPDNRRMGFRGLEPKPEDVNAMI